MKVYIVLRFGTLDLVRGEWRTYDQLLGAANSGTLEASAVSIEENAEKTPFQNTTPAKLRYSRPHAKQEVK